MEIIEPKVSLEWATLAPARTIEMAARTCYKSIQTLGSSEDFVKRIVLQNGHKSVMEHVSASLRIICDRGISHEIVRHRMASYSQESTRYVNYTKEKHGNGNIQFIRPIGLNEEQIKFSERAFQIEQDLYNEAIKLGMNPQQARDFLPNGVKTELVMTANAREWRDSFLALRTADSAHPKMQVIAKMVGYILYDWCPCLFEEYQPEHPIE
jgi:thymidylate synthase (FAD)